MSRVLVPLPDHDCDVTEVAVPWRLPARAGHEVIFATERGGGQPMADPLLLRGVLFGQLGVGPEPRFFYRDLEDDPAFRSPLRRSRRGRLRRVDPPRRARRRHAPVSRLGPPAGAGRCLVDPRTGRSVLYERRMTCLPKYMERTAYWLTAWKLGRYYRTYPTYVEDEVRAALRDPQRQFERGPPTLIRRDRAGDLRPGFVVRDGRYVSAPWPGDAYAFTAAFQALLPAA